MNKAIILATIVFSLCLAERPQEAEACGVKIGLKGPRVALSKESSNPSNILVVGDKDNALLRRLRTANHKVAYVSTVEEARSKNYNLVIVDEEQHDAATDRFTQSQIVKKKSSYKATVNLAERVLSRRETSESEKRVAVGTEKKRTPIAAGSDQGTSAERRKVSESGTVTSVPQTQVAATTTAPAEEVAELKKPRATEASEPKSVKVSEPKTARVSEPKATKVSEPKATKASEPMTDDVEEVPQVSNSKAKWTREFQFGTNQTTLNSAAQKRIRANVLWLEQNPSASLTIEGHTDSVGEDAYNLDLSERRANMARDVLIGMGIDESRITVVAKGEREPAVQPSTSGRNRRIVLIKQP